MLKSLHSSIREKMQKVAPGFKSGLKIGDEVTFTRDGKDFVGILSGKGGSGKPQVTLYSGEIFEVDESMLSSSHIDKGLQKGGPGSGRHKEGDKGEQIKGSEYKIKDPTTGKDIEFASYIPKSELKDIQGNKTKEIIDSITNGTDEYFGVGHFHASNMADYSMMSDTINDMVNVYGIDETQAADIIQSLTHGDKKSEKTLKSLHSIYKDRLLKGGPGSGRHSEGGKSSNESKTYYGYPIKTWERRAKVLNRIDELKNKIDRSYDTRRVNIGNASRSLPQRMNAVDRFKTQLRAHKEKLKGIK